MVEAGDVRVEGKFHDNGADVVADLSPSAIDAQRAALYFVR